jgi:hypothetical protein
MRIKLVDPLGLERLAHLRVQLLRKRTENGLTGRHELEVRELLAGEQVVPGGGDAQRRAAS